MSQSILTRPAAPNVVAIVGFAFVMVGLAGFYAPAAFIAGAIGAVLCGIALFRRPRGLAIAGLIVGIIEIIAGLIYQPQTIAHAAPCVKLSDNYFITCFDNLKVLHIKIPLWFSRFFFKPFDGFVS